ncbi:hypothetical protein [Streptomyces sp. SID8352]|uniref:hypothetical protein n=1 Tax=Streptomyces sp. SID8352 TaxID=2690338 RepID=UPI00136CA799|nr:hypothetical protein [Streptomyces sp. SID8352]MYU20971.1 hypothetical protein [Streptomyces sp. SID8352]
MSTAQSPRPDEAGRTPEGPGRFRAWRGAARGAPAVVRWGPPAALGAVVGGGAWGVMALLAPDSGGVRRIVAAVLCAVVALLAQYLLDLDPRARARDRAAAEHIRRVENALAGQGATVRDGLHRQEEDLRGALHQQEEHLRGALGRHTEEVKRALVEQRRAPQPYPRLDRARADGVPELAKNFAEVLAPGPAILHSFVRLEMKRVLGHMADLTGLSAECAGENHDWMLTLTRAAEHSISAISTSVDREFWSSEPAGRYLQAQQRAIEEQDVPVRRLFLLGGAADLDDRLLRLCEEQELLRIEIRVAVLPELPPNLQRGTTDDFIVFDEQVSFEIEQDLRDVNVRTRLLARQDHVQGRMKRFRELWDAGMGLRELEVRVDAEQDGNWMVDHG